MSIETPWTYMMLCDLLPFTMPWVAFTEFLLQTLDMCCYFPLFLLDKAQEALNADKERLEMEKQALEHEKEVSEAHHTLHYACMKRSCATGCSSTCTELHTACPLNEGA